ncbi:hypothetical protein BGZ99_003835 [Dissophora globulifera]|uniref:Uncharacterized protein n=1 Tax=Dissophora globulifera TaxID=979702 RepID=A0A9P6RT58_9FUNG|nr:hypothetical protein BGZ99_003835 [Dissophora globulifera]
MTSKKPTLSADDNRDPSATCVAKSSSSAASAPPPASIMVSPHDSPSVLVVKSQSKRRSYISSVVATLTTNRKAIGHSSSLSALTCICGSKCDAIFDEMSRNLDNAVFEYSECICLSKGACGGEVKKPDNPPENARLQRLWFHALDMKDYMGVLEGYIDELEGSLKEYVCTRMKQRDLVELERTRLQCELEVVKTRTTLLDRWR